MQVLIFDSLVLAESSLAEVDSSMGLPKVNYNALTGQPEPGRTGTETWAEIKPYFSTPGKFYFECPSDEHKAAISSPFIEEEYSRDVCDGIPPNPYL